MTTTFTVASDSEADVSGWRVEHAFGIPVNDEIHSTERAALGDLLEHNVSCTDTWCVRHGGYIRPIMTRVFATVEIGDAIAPMLSAALGLSPKAFNHGVFDAAGMLARVENAVNLVSIMAEIEIETFAAADTLIGCGGGPLAGTLAAEGCGVEMHLLDLLGKLSELVEHALSIDREIVSA